MTSTYVECRKCGTTVNIPSGQTSARCPSCDSPVFLPLEIASQQTRAFALCPTCGCNDRTTLVTALIDQDTRTVLHQNPSPTGGESTRLSPPDLSQTQPAVTQTSVLAEKLQPPAEPTPPEMVVIKDEISWMESVSDVDLLAACCVVALLLAVGLVAHAWIHDSPIAALAGAALAIIAGIAGKGQQIERARRAQTDQANQTALAQHRADSADWRHQMTRWRKLYYCYRDGTVFVLGESVGAPLEEMHTILATGQPSSLVPSNQRAAID